MHLCLCWMCLDVVISGFFLMFLLILFVAFCKTGLLITAHNPILKTFLFILILRETKCRMANHKTGLQVGVKAPDFKVKDQTGKVLSLKDFKGKKLVLYFYPKDSTPTCTVEACNLRDNFAVLKKKGYAVIGVSADDEKAHKKFIDKHQLPFSLLVDTEMQVIKAYDVWGEKKFMGRVFDGINRTTFVIDEKGKIEKVITEVNSKNHAQQILEN